MKNQLNTLSVLIVLFGIACSSKRNIMDAKILHPFCSKHSSSEYSAIKNDLCKDAVSIDTIPFQKFLNLEKLSINESKNVENKRVVIKIEMYLRNNNGENLCSFYSGLKLNRLLELNKDSDVIRISQPEKKVVYFFRITSIYKVKNSEDEYFDSNTYFQIVYRHNP